MNVKKSILSVSLPLVLIAVSLVLAQFPVTVTDQTPAAPLANPLPSSYQPRYISGFGTDENFTVFFEDRDAAGKISYVQTTTGPTGFAASATATNITDTHFCIKDWPINIGGIDYAYRAWGSVGNNLEHHFYVSNDLVNWTLESTFTIPNAATFTDAHGWVYYGFHDVIQINGTYYAFAESNQSQTMLVRSTNGDDVWEAFASIGGRPGWGPLELPSGVSYGWTPSGSFVDLGHNRGYGKIYVDPRDSNFYLAINTAAKTSLAPAALEAAFIDPANWTWHDNTTGPASNFILSATAEHDIRECWVVANSDPDADWVIIYDADFGATDGGKALGYATLTPPLLPPTEVWIDDDWNDQDAVDSYNSSLIWQYNAFQSLQDGIDAVPSGTASERSVIHVLDGIYGSPGVGTSCEGFPGAILIRDLDYLTIQAVSGHEPVVRPTTAVEVNVVSIVVENSNHLIIDNIDSDQSVAQFDNWHVCGSNDLTVRNSTFEGGEDGIDFNTDLTTALIEKNTFKDINTGSGDEVLDFTDGSYSDVIIQDNSFHNNYRHITIYPPSGQTANNFTIRRNIMDGTTSQEGVRFNDGGGLVSDIILENNVIMNSRQQGLYLKPPVANITVRHNTFFNNTEEEIRLRETAADVLLKNNIIYANGTHAAISARAPFPPGPLALEDYNLIYNAGSGTEDNNASPIIVFGSNTITGLDPLFVNTTAGSEDLHLSEGSPAIAAGTDLGVTDDLENNERPQPTSSNPDMGAFESPQPLLPMALKQKVSDDLTTLLPTGDKKIDDLLEKAIRHIDNSLDDDLWEDPSHLTRKGKNVFEEEKKGVHELMKIEDLDVSVAINTLVEVDRTLAQTAIDEAKDADGKIKEIDKAQEEMGKALDEISKGNFDKAIEHYKKAWDHAFKAADVKNLAKAGVLEGSEVEISAVPDEFGLAQNYPNPFNPKTTIQFSLPEAGIVTLRIYNISGQLIKTLVSQFYEAGSYNVEWHAENLPSGFYLYRIQVNHYSRVMKMMLMK